MQELPKPLAPSPSGTQDAIPAPDHGVAPQPEGMGPAAEAAPAPMPDPTPNPDREAGHNHPTTTEDEPGWVSSEAIIDYFMVLSSDDDDVAFSVPAAERVSQDLLAKDLASGPSGPSGGPRVKAEGESDADPEAEPCSDFDDFLCPEFWSSC